MHPNLSEIPVGELLQKFGAGSHKPGSGSAAAQQGMLAAQLLRTVVDISNGPKYRLIYKAYLPELLRIKNQVEQEIYPALEIVFQKDSELFDKVITLRLERDKEQDHLKKRKLALDANEALKEATLFPMQIAEHCLKLVTFAEFVFDHGFRHARGDSGVALNAAISAIGGCLSIIELNLSSLPDDTWMKETLARRKLIRDHYETVYGKGRERLTILEKEHEEKRLFQQNIAIFQDGNMAESNRSTTAIEKLVRDLQNTVWIHREQIWKSNTPTEHLHILQPEKVLKKVIGYTYLESDNLGINDVGGERFEIAGLIDKSQKLVKISKRFPKESQRFTAAHELGHAILHPQMVMHRDKSLDGSRPGSKSLEEMQADKFATFFLMPSKLVTEIFETLFLMPRIVIDNNTAHYMRFRSASELRQQCRNLRGLSRLLADTGYFAGNSFNSLSKIFGVSITTMAIRLEELDLVEY